MQTTSASGSEMQQSRNGHESGKILVVDDNEMNRDMLRRRLQRSGYQVVCASDGEHALQAVVEQAFDLILLDVMMPGMSGLSVLATIRNDFSRTQLPVVMATAKDSSEDIVQALSIGANDYVTKPLDMKVTLARVSTHVMLKKTTEALESEIVERKIAQEQLAEHARQLEYNNYRLSQAEQELQQTVEELRQKNESLEEFAYVTSHDLQDPIRKIIAFGELLKTDLGESLDEAADEHLALMTNAALRMRELVINLLALAKAGLAAVGQTVDLDACVDAALDALSAEVTRTGTTVVRAPLPEVRGNPTLLTQLFQNLIGNAMKFASQHRPVIEITVESGDPAWVFGIKDNGIGIDERFAKQIFKPFQRLHSRHEYEGTGIGLAICNRAVQRHGGRIWVDSRPGEGAHFQFTLQPTENARLPTEPAGAT